MCAFFFFFFNQIFSTPFPKELTQMSFHTSHHNWIKDVRISSESQVLLAVQYVLSVLTIWLISLFGCAVQRATAEEGRSEKKTKKNKPGHGDDTAAGGANQSFLLAPLSWEPSGRRRGVRSAVERPNMPRHMKGLVDHSLWGDWMQRRRPLAGHNKDGLDCEREPRAGARWTRSYARAEAHLYPLIGSLFNQRPSGESRY